MENGSNNEAKAITNSQCSSVMEGQTFGKWNDPIQLNFCAHNAFHASDWYESSKQCKIDKGPLKDSILVKVR